MNWKYIKVWTVLYLLLQCFFVGSAIYFYQISKDIWGEVVFLEKMFVTTSVVSFCFFRFRNLKNYLLLFLFPTLIAFCSLFVYFLIVFFIPFKLNTSADSNGYIPLVSIFLINLLCIYFVVKIYWIPNSYRH